MSKHITLVPPAGYFAAVQVETRDGEIVGAETCQHQDGSPRKQIAATVKKTDPRGLVLRWVYEDSSLGTVVQDFTPPPRHGETTHTGPLRKFTCGEADWLLEHGVDPKEARRFPRGMTLAQIVAELNGD